MRSSQLKPTKLFIIKQLQNSFFSASVFNGKKVPAKLTPLVLALGFIPQQSLANTANLQSCQPELIAKQQQIPAKTSEQTQNLEADKLSQPTSQQYLLEGNAIIKQPGMVILSDEALFNKTDDTAVFKGQVELHSKEMTITADKANIDNKQQKAELTATKYQLLPSRVYGQSDNITIDEQNQSTQLAKASLTACRINTDDSVDWDLKFKQLEIDDKSRRVVGKDTTLYFKGVPVFYTPYFDYPLDDRASGLLFPEIGSYKSINQTEASQYIKVPYYFNIAANMDDTLTAIPMSQRGLALDNEFRYMAQSGEVAHNAEISVTGIQDSKTNTDRWRATIDANQNWGHGFSSTLKWDDVSDLDFYADIPVNKDYRTATLKQRLAQVDYRQDSLHAYIQVLSYLQLQNSSTNYEKLPEFGLLYSKQFNNTEFALHATATEFVVPTAGHTKPEALRLHIAPQISHRIEKSYGHLTTTLVANQTQYQMKDNGFNPSTKSSIDRFVPQFAVRGGLVFERDFNWNGAQYTQTLEPEIQYLYSGFTDQSDIALFDTAERSLDFNNLFALNRFSGSDRIADANQVAAAVTTKLQNEKGQTLAEAGIGQIAYLEDRKVVLSGNTSETETTSDIFIKLGASFNNFWFSSTSQLDRVNQQLNNANSRIKWSNQQDTVLINHSLFDKGQASEIETLSLGGYTNINHKWDLGYYGSYDMRNSEFNAQQIGLRYDSCCWAAEIVAERTQLQNGLYNDGIQIQFELKGLSSSGSQFRQDLTNKLNF